MQKVAVGRIVHFYPGEFDSQARHNGAKMVPAIISSVGDVKTGCVNLKVFQDGANVLWRTSVMPKEKAPKGEGYYEWPVVEAPAGDQSTSVDEEAVDNAMQRALYPQPDSTKESADTKLEKKETSSETGDGKAAKADEKGQASKASDSGKK